MFEVDDGNRALSKVYVFYFQGESLSDPAAEVEEHPNKQLVSQI